MLVDIPERITEHGLSSENTQSSDASEGWFWSLEGSGEFSVASIRRFIDDQRLLTVDSKTLWIKSVPIKVNILAWKIKLEALPTRFNISRRAALNPCFNVNGVDYLIESISRDLEFFDDTFASKSKSYFNESLEGLYNLYYAKYGNPTQSSQTSGGATSSKVSGGNKYSRLLSGLKAHTKKKARITNPTMSSEYERYVNSDFVTHLHPKDFASFDVLSFWKEKETMFPVLSRMAMDIISVQASSVASESAFSTSGRVLSIRRTRLTPTSLEMCMCLKDHLDAKERKQDKCPFETPLYFEEGVFDDEVQQNEAIPLSDEEIALDASSEGTMSSGGPRYDYMYSGTIFILHLLNPSDQILHTHIPPGTSDQHHQEEDRISGSGGGGRRQNGCKAAEAEAGEDTEAAQRAIEQECLPWESVGAMGATAMSNRKFNIVQLIYFHFYALKFFKAHECLIQLPLLQ
ncbi:zinc finger BED domain-containing protein RICESLEEPER 2 [Tanacetum coccineum]|uniref:Zinc finger BED domain-containing protein RICESLEEPER 2 n=1 Tax=Tanacetum coccineum TaxID=301880 RepID=A0ABQ4YDM4_9ASTR